MAQIKKIGLLILAIIGGYAVMVIGLLLSQDIAFGGIVLGKTKLWEIVIAGIGAFISAFFGGYVAGWNSPFKRYIPQLIMSFEAIVESIYLYKKGILLNPIWFDSLSVLTLIAGILFGGFYYLKKYRKTHQPKADL